MKSSHGGPHARVELPDWHETWSSVASELTEFRATGLDRLLTEDVVRFSTVRALVRSGVAAARLQPEWRHPAIQRGAVDLVVDDPPSAAIEFKYPREPNETNAAWTNTLGEMLKDLYRLASLREHVEGPRFAVQVVSDRLRRYLDGRADAYGTRVVADAGRQTELDARRVQALPSTARNLVAAYLEDHPLVRTRCHEQLRLGGDLTLFVQEVL